MMKHGNNKMAKMNYNWYRSTRVHDLSTFGWHRYSSGDMGFW